MKRIISFILAVAMALSLAACGSSGDENSGGNNGAQATPQPTPTPKVLLDTLAISKYDDEKITNDYTGLEFTLGDEWSMIDRETMCSVYMPGVTAQQLEEMTADQLNRLIEIFDYVAMDIHGHMIMVAIANYAASGLSADEYLNTFKENNFPAEAHLTDEKTATLSGVEYTNFTAYYDNLVNDICYLDRGDGHLVMVISRLKGNVSPYYAHSFFNGGPLTDTDTANVPGLFEYDAEKARIINTDTAIEIDIPDGWKAVTRQFIAEEYYNTDEAGLNSMTAGDFARLSEINDIVMSKSDSSITVVISYINRKADYAYGMSALEMAEHLYYQCDALKTFSGVSEEISFAGQTYASVDMYSYDSDATLVYFFRELNKDYMVNVTIYAEGDQFVYDLREIFDKDNDTDMLIKRSERVEGKYQFHNQYSDVRINILKGWERNDQVLFKVMNNKNLSEDLVAAWTDEDYMNSAYIPDFAVTSEDQTTTLVVYYMNLNKFAGEKPDVNSIFDSYKTAFEKDGYITVEDNCIYTRGGYDYLVYKSTDANEKINMQFATAEISDDYVIMLIYITPIDSAVPDVTGVINDR